MEDTVNNIFFVIMALLMISAPKALWWLRYGHIKDAEPSEWSINSTRIFGVIILILAVFSIIFE